MSASPVTLLVDFTRLPGTDEPVVREILAEGIALIGSIPRVTSGVSRFAPFPSLCGVYCYRKDKEMPQESGLGNATDGPFVTG